MVRRLEGLEPRRGCGYRHVGKLYIIGSGIATYCHRLPIPLTRCPVCGEGIKFTRGWIRLNPLRLFDVCGNEVIRCPECGEVMKASDEFAGRKLNKLLLVCDNCKIAISKNFSMCTCNKECYVCNPPEKAFMLWVGEKFYPTPRDFSLEAEKLGVCKAVPSIPKDFEIGKSIVYLAHRKAVTTYIEDPETLTGYKTEKTPGIFLAFIPLRFELLVKESDYNKNKEKYDEMEERGIEIVLVPDNYDEIVKRAEEEYKKKRKKGKKSKGRMTNKELKHLLNKAKEVAKDIATGGDGYI